MSSPVLFVFVFCLSYGPMGTGGSMLALLGRSVAKGFPFLCSPASVRINFFFVSLAYASKVCEVSPQNLWS